MPIIISLDQGTTSSRTIAFNEKLQQLAIAQQEFTQIFPKPGWVEHDPNEILSSQLKTLELVIEQLEGQVDELAGIGITNQRETTILWDRNTGEPVYNAIVWQCRRSMTICDELKEAGLEQTFKQKTGLVLDAYFSGTKVKWLFDHVEGLRERAIAGDLLFGTVDTWLLWKMTQGKVHATDFTNASRTLLFNIHTKEWDREILELLEIPISILPAVHPSGYRFGEYFCQKSKKEIPILAIAGDQQAALYGQHCWEKGQVKNTYGTGCFMLMNTGDEPIQSNHGLLTTLAAGSSAQPQFALEGAVFMGGAIIQWLRDELQLIDHAAESEIIAMGLSNNGGVYMVPAFVGLGSPYWDMQARATIFGMTRGTHDTHLVRAGLEAIAYQSYDLLKAMEEDLGEAIQQMKVDGGAAANQFLMQFQSDIMQSKIVKSKYLETTALGVATLALQVLAPDEHIDLATTLDRVYEPQVEKAEVNELLAEWKRAIKATLYWSHDS